MWKAHNLAGKMRPSKFQYNQLTLTYGIFHVNRDTFPEFSQILYQQFWTFHSSLIVPAMHHLNAIERSFLLFCFYVHIGLFQLALRAI